MEQIRAMRSLLRATVDKTRGVVGPLMARRSAVAKPPVKHASADIEKGSFEAVAVRPGANACAAAETLAHKRLLSGEAPQEFPLRGCDASRCRCRLEQFDDRRAADARRQSIPESEANGHGEQRLPGDRRVKKQRARPTSYFNDFQ